MGKVEKQKYREYLQSERWKFLSELAKENAGNRCQVCNSDGNLNVHHREYPQIWGEESLDFLTVLCKNCHGTFHRKMKMLATMRAVIKYWFDHAPAEQSNLLCFVDFLDFLNKYKAAPRMEPQ